MYIEDALGDRVWVDLESCKDLIANLCTLFGTKACGAVPSASKGSGEHPSKGPGGGEHPSKGASGDGDHPGKGVGGGEQGKGGEGSEGLTGELSKDDLLSGIEIAPRYVCRFF